MRGEDLSAHEVQRAAAKRRAAARRAAEGRPTFSRDPRQLSLLPDDQPPVDPPLERAAEARRPDALTAADRQRLRGARRSVLFVLLHAHDVRGAFDTPAVEGILPGGWVDLALLRTVGGTSGDRRARELRALGLDIEKHRFTEGRKGEWHYRLAPDSITDARLLLYGQRYATPGAGLLAGRAHG